MTSGNFQFVLGGFFFLFAALSFALHNPLVGALEVLTGLLAFAAGWMQRRVTATAAQRSEPDPD